MNETKQFFALDFPETLPDKQQWLEGQIVSPDFLKFLEQLSVVLEAGKDLPEQQPANQSLEDIGLKLSTILASGFEQLTSDQFHALLLSPKALLQLNEIILASAGEYWKKKVDWVLESGIASKSNQGETVEPASVSKQTAAGNPLKSILAIAAALMLVLAGVWIVNNFGGSDPDKVAQGWGWERDDWFDEAKTAEQYVDRLIAGAKAWHAKPVDTYEAYNSRLKQLMNGCQKMIDAEHPLLSESQRKVLVEKCIAWKEKFESQLVKATPENYQSVKVKTDETVEKAAKALGTILNA